MNKQIRVTKKQLRQIARQQILEEELREYTRGIFKEQSSRDAAINLIAQAQTAEEAIQLGGDEMRDEVDSSKFSGMLESFFNSVGIVDPCDLVRKDRGAIQNERDALQAAVDELNLAKARDVKDRLSSFSKLIGGLGVGSLAYFGLSNMGEGLKYGKDWVKGVVSDTIRGVDKEKKAALDAQEAEKTQRHTNLKRGTSAQQATDAVLNPDLDPKKKVAIMPYEEATKKFGEQARQDAQTFISRLMSTGWDDESGKRYRPFQFYAIDMVKSLKAKDKEGKRIKRPDAKRMSQRAWKKKYEPINQKRRRQGKKPIPMPDSVKLGRATSDPKLQYKASFEHGSRVELHFPQYWAEFKNGPNGARFIQGAGLIYDQDRFASRAEGKFQRSFPKGEFTNKNDLKTHPDYLAMNSIPAAMIASAMAQDVDKNYQKRGFASKKDHWGRYRDLMNELADYEDLANMVNPIKAWWSQYERELGEDDPTRSRYHRRVYGQSGGDSELHTAPGMEKKKINRQGKPESKYNWVNQGFATVGKYAVLAGAILFVYDKLLDWAPGVLCTVKSFVGSIMGSIGKVLKGIYDYTIGPVVNVIKGWFGMSESNRLIDARKIHAWNELVECVLGVGETLNNRNRETKMSQDKIRKIIRKSLVENKRISDEQKIRKIVRESIRKKSSPQRLVEQKVSDEALAAALKMVNSKGRADAARIIKQGSKDAMAMYTAMHGLGTDDDAIDKIMAKRANDLPALYDEFTGLMNQFKVEGPGFIDNFKKSGPAFLAGSGLWALAAYAGDKAKVAAANKIADEIQDQASGVLDKMPAVKGTVDAIAGSNLWDWFKDESKVSKEEQEDLGAKDEKEAKEIVAALAYVKMIKDKVDAKELSPSNVLELVGTKMQEPAFQHKKVRQALIKVFPQAAQAAPAAPTISGQSVATESYNPYSLSTLLLESDEQFLLEFDIGGILSKAISKTVTGVLNKGVADAGSAISKFVKKQLEKPLSKKVDINAKPQRLSSDARNAIEAAASVQVVRDLQKQKKVNSQEAEKLIQGVYQTFGVTAQDVMAVSNKIGGALKENVSEFQETYNHDLSLLLLEDDDQFLLEFDLGNISKGFGKAQDWIGGKVEDIVAKGKKQAEKIVAKTVKGDKKPAESAGDASKEIPLTDKLKKMAAEAGVSALEIPESMGGKALKGSAYGLGAAAAYAALQTVLPKSYDDDLIQWLKDDGRDADAEKIARALRGR